MLLRESVYGRSVWTRTGKGRKDEHTFGGLSPNISNIAVAAFERTIRVGKYEASSTAILYAFDERYRRRAKHRQEACDRSLGGTVRRLRLERGLRQKDFPGVTAKEVARIERGEVKKPHLRTLARIAKRLGVLVREISRYRG
jgi:helix-turn-helix protein